MQKENFHKLSPNSLGLSLGLLSAVCIFLLAIFSIVFNGWGKTMILEISSIYVGYAPSMKGAVIGAIWGFGEGFIGGYVLAWLYNIFLKND